MTKLILLQLSIAFVSDFSICLDRITIRMHRCPNPTQPAGVNRFYNQHTDSGSQIYIMRKSGRHSSITKLRDSDDMQLMKTLKILYYRIINTQS